MFDYLDFRSVAYKHKYDVAVVTDKKSFTYGDLMSVISALSNALFAMNAKGSALVLLPNGVEFICSCLALSKSGFDITVAPPSISKLELCAICKDKTPDVVVICGDEMVRLATTLSKLGCTCAIVNGNLQNVLPQEFEYTKLIHSHDSDLASEPEVTSGIKRFLDSCGEILQQADEGTCIEAPMWESGCAGIVYQLLSEGKRVVILNKNDKRSLRKHKIDSVLTTQSAKNIFAAFAKNVITVDYPETVIRTGARLFDTERIGTLISAYCKACAKVFLSGVRVHVEITVDGEFDKSAPEANGSVAALKNIASDIMYATECPKTFAVRQKSV